MELKILCHCGNKYKFDVEPVNGQAPGPLACPSCGASWTETANAIIAQNLGTTGIPAPAPAAAPAPVANTYTNPMATPPSPPPPQATGPRLKVSSATHASASAAPSIAVAPALSVAAAGQQAASAPRFVPNVPTLDVLKEPPAKGNFAMGMVGGLLGAALGMGIWLGIFYGTGWRLKVLALGVGYLAGLGAKLLSKDEGSKELGVITAVLALVAIFGAQYLIAKEQLFGGLREVVDDAYQMQVEYAKETLKEMPNLTDDEIKKFLAKEEFDDEGNAIKPASISKEQVKEFREKQLPELQDLASGKLSKEQYRKKMPEKEIEENTGVKLFLVVRGLGLFSLALMITAAGLAYKVTADA